MCLKFRTMYSVPDSLRGKESTRVDDPRVTPVGKVLRRTSLDEMPQFVNVLLGQMSIVGPRPHRLELDQEFRQAIPTYDLRKRVRPGITGHAQVSGWRGPTDTLHRKRMRVQHDLWYIEHWSLLLDMKIVFKTVFSRRVRDNAF